MSKRQVTGRFVEQSVNAFGIQILVRISHESSSSSEPAKTMLARLTEAWKDSPEPVELFVGRPVIDLGEVNEANFERVHSLMSTEVTLAALKAHSGTCLMFHAGGIARDDGSVAVIIGPSGRGKTTTMRQLGQHYAYVSDETIAITDNGEILPYRKPLSVVDDGHRHKLQIAPSDIGLLPLPNVRLSLGGIALLERAKNGEAESIVSNIGFAHGLAEATEQSSYLFEMDQPLATVCAAAASVGGFKRLTVGKPSRIHEIAKQLFVKGPAPYWTRMMPLIGDVTSSEAAYLPGGVVDAVECEDGTVVFTESRKAIVLNGIGPQLWRAACHGDSWEHLIARIENEHGPSPSGDSKSVIQSIAAELIVVGVLRAPASIGDVSING